MAQHMLSTVDNPWSPVDNWDEWLAYDTRAGYDTPALLARLANNSDELSQSDQDAITEAAIDELCLEIGTGFYIKVPIPD